MDLCLEVGCEPRPGLNRTPKANLARLSRRRMQFNYTVNTKLTDDKERAEDARYGTGM